MVGWEDKHIGTSKKPRNVVYGSKQMHIPIQPLVNDQPFQLRPIVAFACDEQLRSRLVRQHLMHGSDQFAVTLSWDQPGDIHNRWSAALC